MSAGAQTGVQTRATAAMANVNNGEPGGQITLASIMAKLQEMDHKHDVTRQMLEMKIDSLRNELKRDIDQKFETFQTEMNDSLVSIKSDYASLKVELETLQNRLTTVENRNNQQEDYDPVNNVDKTIVVANLKEEADDPLTLNDTVDQLIEALGDSVSQEVTVVQTKRLVGRDNKPGLVKVALDSLESKIKVLKSKKNLRNNETFKRVWLRSSKSHTDRVAEMNFKKILQLVPGGDKLKISGNGKIIDDGNGNDGVRGASSGVGGANGRGAYRGRGEQNRGIGRGTSPRGSPRGGPRGGPGGRGMQA